VGIEPTDSSVYVVKRLFVWIRRSERVLLFAASTVFWEAKIKVISSVRISCFVTGFAAITCVGLCFRVAVVDTVVSAWRKVKKMCFLHTERVALRKCPLAWTFLPHLPTGTFFLSRSLTLSLSLSPAFGLWPSRTGWIAFRARFLVLATLVVMLAVVAVVLTETHVAGLGRYLKHLLATSATHTPRAAGRTPCPVSHAV
jgi:hypothetical protein